MELFVDILERVHPEQEIEIDVATVVADHGYLILYRVSGDATNWNPHVANVVAGVVKWAHPVDYDITQLARLQPRPVGPEENIGSCDPGPDLRQPLWDKTGNVWHTDTKAGRYSVRRPGKRMPYQAYLNNNEIQMIMPDSDPEVIKRSINRRILEARRIAHIEDPAEARKALLGE